MKSCPASSALDQQINDYLLTASGHLNDAKGVAVDARRVASYGAAAGSALVMMSQAEAAVQVNQGTPRPVTAAWVTGTTIYAPIDMNGDGVNDFWVFAARPPTGRGLNGNHADGVSNSVMTGSYNLQKLTFGATISPGKVWNTANSTLRDVFYSLGSGTGGWNGTAGETGFAGVRFKDNQSNTHYGWIRLRINGQGSLSATCWAYESVAGASITTPTSKAAADALCTPPAIPAPAMGLPALGLAALALGGLGLTSLRRRRDARKSV